MHTGIDVDGADIATLLDAPLTTTTNNMSMYSDVIQLLASACAQDSGCHAFTTDGKLKGSLGPVVQAPVACFYAGASWSRAYCRSH